MAALRRQRSRGSEKAAGAYDAATKGIPGQGERDAAKRRQAPWEVDPDNPMALWNPELGGFGGEIEADSQSESDGIDIDAILRDEAARADSHHEGPDDDSDAEPAPMTDEGAEEVTDQDSSDGSAAGLSAAAGGKGAPAGDSGGDGSGEMYEDDGEGRVWVPELRKMVKDTNIVHGGTAMFVNAEEREDSSGPSAPGGGLKWNPSRRLASAGDEEGGSDDTGTALGRTSGGDEEAAGGLLLEQVLQADVEEFEPFNANGIDCVLHR
jgi:hypothetical protein